MYEFVGSFRPLCQVLAEVQDPRRRQGCRHPLPAILSMACAAMLCGCRTYPTIAEWGRLHGGEVARALGFTREKTPAASTLFSVLSRLDREKLERLLGAWAEEVLQARGQPGPPGAGGGCTSATQQRDRAAEQAQQAQQAQGRGPMGGGAPSRGGDGRLEGVAIDGKTLRGSRRQEAPGVHLLSAFSHRLGMTLGQVGVDDKTNEILAVQELLKELVLTGKVVTVDALLTQKEVAKTIRQKGGTTS